jgi:hypothetical protein
MCETWSLKLREEHSFKVSENKVLKRILRSDREEVAGNWKKLHSQKLHNSYSSPIITELKSRMMRCAEHIACMGDITNAYKMLIGQPE